MCVYCLLKMRLGVLKVSLCIYLVFGFLRSYLAFLWVDLAFFAYGYLAILVATSALGSYYERVKYSWSYLGFASFNAPYNPIGLVYE